MPRSTNPDKSIGGRPKSQDKMSRISIQLTRQQIEWVQKMADAKEEGNFSRAIRRLIDEQQT